MRIEPPPSLAWAIGNMPPATAAAAPPLEPPGRAARVPGVAGRAEAAVLSCGDHAELGRVGASAEDEAGTRERVDDQFLALARALRRAVRAVGDRPAGDRRQVLDRQRHAEERRRLALASRRSASTASTRACVVVAPGDGVQLGVAARRRPRGTRRAARPPRARALRNAAASSSAGVEGPSCAIRASLPELQHRADAVLGAPSARTPRLTSSSGIRCEMNGSTSISPRR